jgi:hypothetical protein
MTNSAQTRKQLEELFVDSDEFKELERKRFGYCPFEALGMVNAEIRHSNFLAAMMDPFGPHGFGPLLLREVLDGLVSKIGSSAVVSRLQLHVNDLDDVEIHREWSRIDLLIVVPDAKLVVAFEMKIGAAESQDQTTRYREAVERQWPKSGDRPWQHLFLFLTRDETAASDPIWHPVTYDIIIEAIARTLKRTAGGEPLARTMLDAYASMLRKHHMEDRELEQLARQLWAKHEQALDYLMQQRPDGLASLGPVMLARHSDVAGLASTEHLHLAPEESTPAYVRFLIREWEPLHIADRHTDWLQSGRMLVLELKFERHQVKVGLFLGPGPSEWRETLFRHAQPAIKKRAGSLSDKWKTLASEKLLTATAGREDDEAAMAKLIANLKTFLSGTVMKFDAQFRPLLDQATRTDAAQ